jgi:hypothetical protein
VAGNSKQAQLKNLKPVLVAMSTTNNADLLRIQFISWLILLSASDMLHPIYVSAVSSRISHTTIEADRRRTLEIFQREQTAPLKDDEDLVSTVSPNFISMQPWDAATLVSEVRRTLQSNAACAANPVCAAAGLADDCCPTSSGMFLMCCSQTTPPGAIGFYIF